MQFERAVGLDELESKGGMAVFRSGKKQILITRVGDAIHALDNRCPHEGYPLSKGTVDASSADAALRTLTCNWHNWKFRLSDGHSLIGDDNVRVYPTKIEDDAVWVDVTPPPPEQIKASILKGLRKGIEKRNFGQIARELVRLQLNGFDPLDGVRDAVVITAEHYEYGTTHAYAAMADWLALHAAAARDDDLERALIPLAETIDHMADDTLRRPAKPFPTTSLPFEETAFLDAVEREADDEACALILGAWEDGAGWPELKSVLARAALSHYADFGHASIYVYKGCQAAAVLQSRDVDRALLLCVARSFCYATREDLIPEFANYATALERVQSGEAPGTTVPDNVYGSNVNGALAWTVNALATREPTDVYDELLGETARTLLHYDLSFDTRFDRPVSSNVSWLGLTHMVTFANSVRAACAHTPDLWPAGLLQMACFLGRHSAFTDRNLDVSEWTVSDAGAFRAATHEQLLDHGVPMPIFSCHILKTSLAVFDELDTASPATAALLLASLNRFLHSPMKGKHVRRLVRQGIELVARDF